MVRILKFLSAERSFKPADLVVPGLSVVEIERMLGAVASETGMAVGGHKDGWRLAAPVEWLDRETIVRHSGDAAWTLELVDETSSTHDQIDRMNVAGGGMVALFAEYQTSGRGRQARRWVNVPGCDVLMSAMMSLRRPVDRCMGLSLAIGVAVRDIVPKSRLKWPNDIVTSEGAKLGGILVQARPESSGTCVKIGIGVNHSTPKGTRRGVDRAFASLSDLEPDIGRNAACGWLLKSLSRRIRQFERKGVAAISDEWRQGGFNRRGDRISFHDAAGNLREATYHDIGESGELLLETPSGIEKEFNAEIN